MENLELLLADGVIDAVLGRLKSGKEADLWLVEHGGQVIAAKIYRDRDFRSFKNDAAYKEGRLVGNSRTGRAMARGSKFGREAAEQAWKSAEADTLDKLHAHGVRTPAPVLFYEGVLLMELVVDAQGQPAPRLIDTALTAEAAGALYRDLRSQVVKMLDADIIHGDLSPYNVLMGAAGPTIIDFPQVVAAAHNSLSESFFQRDLENLRVFFAGFDSSLQSCAGDAWEIWNAYVRRELSPDFVPTGRAPPPARHHERRQQQQRQPQAARQPQQQQQRQPQAARQPQQQPQRQAQAARQPQQQHQQQQRQPQTQRQQQPPQQRQPQAARQPQQQHQQQQRQPQRQQQPPQQRQPQAARQPQQQHQQQQRQPQPQRQQQPPQQRQPQQPPKQPPHGPHAGKQGQRHGPQRPGEGAPPSQDRRPPSRPQGPVVERVSRLAGPAASKPQGRPSPSNPQAAPPSQGQPSPQQPSRPGGGPPHGHRHRWRR
jgi:RIO kinase 1